MFTGIIEAKAKVLSLELRAGILSVRIEKPLRWRLYRGESIAIDGICSTVVGSGKDKNWFEVEYMHETLAKTTAAEFVKARVVNLERSLTLQSRLDGHLVQGHVDVRARVAGSTANGESRLLTITLPKELIPYAALHGSIAINGVSLTIARSKSSTITVALIPHTLAHTNLGVLARGDAVNVEVDLLARYSANILKHARLMHHAKKRPTKRARH